MVALSVERSCRGHQYFRYCTHSFKEVGREFNCIQCGRGHYQLEVRTLLHGLEGNINIKSKKVTIKLN